MIYHPGPLHPNSSHRSRSGLWGSPSIPEEPGNVQEMPSDEAHAANAILGLDLPRALYDAPRNQRTSQISHLSFVSRSRSQLPSGNEGSKAGLDCAPVSEYHLDDILRISKRIPEYEFRGWCACVGTGNVDYFYHHATRIVADTDLRSPSSLNLLSGMIDVTCRVRPPPDGWELWIQILPSRTNEAPIQCWIHHETRSISETFPRDDCRNEWGPSLSEVERLEMDIRYWSYIDGHPSHESTCLRAVSSAMNLLTRCHAELILSIPGHTAPPFTLDECQKLADIIRSLDSAHISSEAAFTRGSIAAQVHIRADRVSLRHSLVCFSAPSILPLRNPGTSLGHSKCSWLCCIFLWACFCLSSHAVHFK
ncbi:hypothetical protein OF83DRAFT_849838 [Amylostereum chailletii]|nr:hypothetical protein OF83DRAFT_849838 [Amylostereum chailletii]